MSDTTVYPNDWEPTEEERTPFEEKDPAGRTYPVISVWGKNYFYYGEEGDQLTEKILHIKRGLFIETLARDTATEVIASADYPYTESDSEKFDVFLYDFIRSMLDVSPSVVEEATRRLARFVAANPPLVEFIAAQVTEMWVKDGRDEPVIGGPLHRAVQDVRESLEALR